MTDDTLPLFGYAKLTPTKREAIAEQVASHWGLDRVVRWALTRSPQGQVVDVIKQDEFCQDVVLRYDTSLFLVYDSS
jgi:hypothetical protein